MTDRQYRKYRAEKDNQLDEAYQRTLALFAKTDEKFKETEAQMKRTDTQIAKNEAKLTSMGIQLGGITDNNGSNTEDYFFNSLEEKPVLGGVRYDSIKRNVYAIRFRLEDEYDIVMYNGNSIALIECKYKAHENDLKKLIEKKVENFRTLFPDFKAYSIYLGLASFSFYPELEALAKLNGVAILKQKGDVVEIESDNLKAY